MRKIFLVFLFLLTPSLSMAYEKEIKGIAVSMSGDIAKAGKKTVAAVDFTDLQGNVTELGRFLAEEFSVALHSVAKGFEVVDRTHLKAIVAEHKLSATGIIDPLTARKLGQIAGVDSLITGAITPFGDSVRLSVKVLAVDTAKIISASTTEIAKTKAIEELLEREIEGGKVSPAESPVIPPKPVTKGMQSVEMNGFLFELQKCSLSGQNVTCSLLITNKKGDRNLFIPWGETRIFDNFGNEYTEKGLQLGNKKKTATSGGVGNLLVSGIPTKASLNFDGVSQEANMLSLVEISCRCGDEKFVVQFRNIPLNK